MAGFGLRIRCARRTGVVVLATECTILTMKSCPGKEASLKSEHGDLQCGTQGAVSKVLVRCPYESRPRGTVYLDRLFEVLWRVHDDRGRLTIWTDVNLFIHEMTDHKLRRH